MLRHNRQILDRLLTLRWDDGPRRHLARTVRSTADIQAHRSVTRVQEVVSQLSAQSTVSEENGADSDYLGIREVDDIAIVHGEYGYEERQVQTDQLRQKYKPLLDVQKYPSTGKTQRTWFGQVRLDAENTPRYHGEFEKRDESSVESANVTQVLKHITQHDVKLKDEHKSAFEWNHEEKRRALPPVDENIEVVKSKTVPQSLTNSKINFRYASEFSNSLKSSRVWRNARASKTTEMDDASKDWIAYEKSKREKMPVKGAPQLPDEDIYDPGVLSEKMASVKISTEETGEGDLFAEPKIMSGADYLKQIYKGKVAAHFQEDYDNLQKLIKKNEILDSKGFRILTNQVPDYSKMTNSEILEVLAKQVLFNDADVVAINKPYGMAVHGGGSENSATSTSRVKAKFNTMLHLNYFLPELASRLGCEKLYTVHRLDRDTTGILLLTKTQEKAKELNCLFVEHKIQKKYLCITKNTPDVREGIIDIPIEMGFINMGGVKRERMVLCPEPMEDIRAQRRPVRTARRAVTRYRVLDEAGNAALLEVLPQTGIRHQIRVHLGFGLRCPVLGDHKYSNLDVMAPQRLPADILMRLKVRQQKARHVPMHLHAYMCMIPHAGLHGTNIFVRAPLPYHFRKNMSSLKLRMP